MLHDEKCSVESVLHVCYHGSTLGKAKPSFLRMAFVQCILEYDISVVLAQFCGHHVQIHNITHIRIDRHLTVVGDVLVLPS